MLQYLQSWFPGWGGWSGQQTPEGKPGEGLSAEQHEQWTPEEILGKVAAGLHVSPGLQWGEVLGPSQCVPPDTARGVFQTSREKRTFVNQLVSRSQRQRGDVSGETSAVRLPYLNISPVSGSWA